MNKLIEIKNIDEFKNRIKTIQSLEIIPGRDINNRGGDFIVTYKTDLSTWKGRFLERYDLNWIFQILIDKITKKSYIYDFDIKKAYKKMTISELRDLLNITSINYDFLDGRQLCYKNGVLINND